MATGPAAPIGPPKLAGLLLPIAPGGKGAGAAGGPPDRTTGEASFGLVPNFWRQW